MSNANKTFIRRLLYLKPYLLVLNIFLFYLLIIPEFVKLTTPCINHIPGQSFKVNDCAVTRALDQFMLLALVGFVVGVLVTFFCIAPKSLKLIAVTAAIMALGIIVSYHAYIPRVERMIRSASVVIF